MVAVRQDLQVEQGATFEFAVEVLEEDGQTPRVLAGYTGAMQIREQRNPTALLLATATVDVATGVVTASIAHTVTDDYTWLAGVYDLAITNGTRRERLAWGDVALIRQVTV